MGDVYSQAKLEINFIFECKQIKNVSSRTNFHRKLQLKSITKWLVLNGSYENQTSEASQI